MKGLTCTLFLLFFSFLICLGGCKQERTGGPLMAGDEAPDFMARDLEGDVIVLSNLEGKPVIVRFWETNCKFCKADTPLFNQYYGKYHDKGLSIVYVSAFYEQRPAVDEYIRQLGIEFQVVMDADARLADLFSVKIYPQTFMIGPDRRIIATLFGGVGEAEFEELLGEYLAEK